MPPPVSARRRPAAVAALAATALSVLTAQLAGWPAVAGNQTSGPPAIAQAEPPLGRAVVPPLPLPARPPDPARLEQARALLADWPARVTAAPGGPEAGDRTLGGYLFLTDIAEPALLERVARLVGGLESLYRDRYGRPPLGVPREAIVIFSAEEDYRRFQAGDPRLAGLTGSTGLAAQGIVATYRGRRSDDELLGTLVHELGHLLNRRALGPSLPSWLDEGISDDLGASRISPDGRLLPGTWSRNFEVTAGEIRISGGEAALRNLAERFGPDGSAPGRLGLGSILELEWEAFVAEDRAELHYAAAAGFLRMLLASTDGEVLLRTWLAGIALGASPAAEELRRALGRSWEELEQELALWTRFELARLPPLGP